MKKYNYTNSDLKNKYQLLSERYFMEITEEMIKPECWNRDLNHPVPECFNEDGTLKQECYKTAVQTPVTPVPETSEGPGLVAGGEESMTGFAGSGEGPIGEARHKQHCMVLLGHLNKLEECVGTWMTECDHWGTAPAMEAIQALKEHINECALY